MVCSELFYWSIIPLVAVVVFTNQYIDADDLKHAPAYEHEDWN